MSHSEDEGAFVDNNNDNEEEEDLSDDDDDAEQGENGKDHTQDKSASSGEAVLSLEERHEKAKLISSTRILSQKEFAKVREAQLAKKVDAALPKR